MVSPVISISSAIQGAIKRGSITELKFAPMPIFASGNPNCASEWVMRRSQAKASSNPPAIALPFNAAITGFLVSSVTSNTLRSTCPIGGRNVCWLSSPSRISLRSAPAQKACSPVPVSTTTRTLSSSSALSNASDSVFRSAAESALRRSGRFRVSTRIGPLVSIRSSCAASGLCVTLVPPLAGVEMLRLCFIRQTNMGAVKQSDVLALVLGAPYRRPPDTHRATSSPFVIGKSRLQYLSHLYRALTASKDGPNLYDLCDPLLRGPGGGDAHLRKFYGTAIANPLLRPLLGRAGLPQLRDPSVFKVLREAIAAARDQESPDWLAIGRPVAALLDRFPQRHPARGPAAPAETVPIAEIDRITHACARHLLGTFARHGFIPGYAAFNLIGDPDFRGSDLLIALQGLDARSYKNSTLLFNLARAFI